ncbi:tetratricopeptide repeat protein [Brevibacillus halotolerans]|uniref:tetratricopeptide repeat protein n=1 Tax=Brevibacillus halotolerans TaxID=1507437 RepID=UPI001FE9613F|nr:hypothetical protein [Brevibacillus halotolerans]
MEESFKIGEEVVHYANFLTEQERIILYFRMALQAYAIKKYETCIELCQAEITLEKKDTELKAGAYLAMINSYSDLGDYSTVELHLELFKRFKHNFVVEATKLESAIVKSKKKEYDQAILLLKESLQNISEHARIHVVIELLGIYFELEDVDAVSEIFENEKSLLFSTSTPYN